MFVNLVDFDALWGHRRNVEGYGKEIEKFLQPKDKEALGVVLSDSGFSGYLTIRDIVPVWNICTINLTNISF